MNSKNIALSIATVGLVALTVTAFYFFQAEARQAAAANAADAAAAMLIRYTDQSQLKGYRSSEWGLPAPVAVEAHTAAELRNFRQYWASEKGLTADEMSAQDLLYHDLMIVK